MKLLLNQSQKLTQTLNTQLLQRLDILRFTSLELEQYIYEKGTINPFLTVDEPKIQPSYVEMFHSRSQSTYTDMNNPIQTFVKQHEHYENQFIEQIPLHTSAKDVKILTFLIRSLDERLFLTVDLQFVADLFQTTYTYLEQLVQVIQSFEPIGIGARDYKEYFLLQIKADQASPKLAEQFILNELELLSTRAIKALSQKYKASITEVKKTVNYIRQLRPIQKIDWAEPIQLIQPDVEVYHNGEDWFIQLNQHHLPSISLNNTYIELLKHDQNYQTYFKESLKDALTLIEGIEQRNKTLYNIVNILLLEQTAFFYKGKLALKPMRLKDIAKNLRLHESTISRAIHGKYIKTLHGIYELQSLFVKGITTQNGEKSSVITIKERIKQLINQENKMNPLTDQQLTELLETEGISISRRTVAKYRENMNILKSNQRMVTSG